MLAAGFSSLPSDIQALILNLTRLSRERQLEQHQLGELYTWIHTHPGQTDDLPQVSRALAFEYLAASAVRELQVYERTQFCTASQLPFAPLIETVETNIPVYTRYLCRLLLAPQPSLPCLVSLSLHLISAQDVLTMVAAIAPLTHLTTLTLSVGTNLHQQLSQPPPLLPLLPNLRALHLSLGLRSGAAPWLPLDLAHLSSLRGLTTLSVRTPDLWSRLAADGAVDIMATMGPVTSSLPHLTALRALELVEWTGHQRAEPCWQALAHALPLLRRLTYLSISFNPQDMGGTASCLQALSCGLSCVTSLRHLNITGGTQEEHERRLDAAREATSKQLTLAIGALSALELVQLVELEVSVRAHDCYKHLGQLTGLRELRLETLASGQSFTWQGHQDDPDMLVVGMLSGMTRLTYLVLQSVHLSARAAMALVSLAIPALPELQNLDLQENGLNESACTVLAAKMRDGLLPALQAVGVDLDDAVIDNLDWLAQREVFFWA